MTREPQNISRTDWYYEYWSHILLVHEVRNADDRHIRTDSIKIPWRMIEASRKRRRQSAIKRKARKR